jgi:hypothetical protein
VKRRQIGDDRKPEARSRLRFIEALAPRQRGLARPGGKSWPIIVDGDAKKKTLREIAPGLRRYVDRYRVARPFSGIIDEIANHLLEILAFPLKTNGPGTETVKSIARSA